MATMTCPTCTAPFQPGDLICLECGANLARARAARKHGPTREDTPPSHAGVPSQPGPDPQPAPRPPQRSSPPAPTPSSPPQPVHLPPPVPPAYPQHDPSAGGQPYPPPPPAPSPPHGQPAVPPPRPAVSSVPPPIPARREETLVPPEERQPGRSHRHPEESTAFMCPHCEAVITDQHATVCMQCLRPLRPQPTLRLAFPEGEVKIPVGQHLVLGRDAGQSPVAATFVQYDNVSRRHATVSLDRAGQPRVRDEGSTNGTYVNDERIPPGVDVPLHEGDSLRLAADVTGTVYLS